MSDLTDEIARRRIFAIISHPDASGRHQTDDSRRPFLRLPREKRGSRVTSAVSIALDTRFRGHDEEMRGCQALEAHH